MGVMDEIKMDTGITMESTPIKGENSMRKRKLDVDPNETQGPEMNNPMNPIYKPGPEGDSTDNNQSESNSYESSPKRRKIAIKKPTKRKLVFKDPSRAMEHGSCMHLEELRSTLRSILRLDLLFTVH